LTFLSPDPGSAFPVGSSLLKGFTTDRCAKFELNFILLLIPVEHLEDIPFFHPLEPFARSSQMQIPIVADSNGTMSTPLHPYYPLGVHIPEYVANVNSIPSLLGRFFFLWILVVGLAWFTIGYYRPRASHGDRLAFVWFCFSTFPLDAEGTKSSSIIN
jgi:hypothetical protein